MARRSRMVGESVLTIDAQVLVLALAGAAAGLGASVPSRPTAFGRLLVAAAFGLGLGLVAHGFRSAWPGLLLVAASVNLPGVPPRLRGALVATGGVLLTLLTVRSEVSPAVTVPGVAVFASLALLARPQTGTRLSMLVTGCTAVSLFGVYSAVPDTEAAIGLGVVALGLSAVAWRPGVEVPLILAVATVTVAILVGSARQTSITLQALPSLGLFAALSVPRWGAWLENRLVGAPARQLSAFCLHGLVCGLPRWLIVGHW